MIEETKSDILLSLLEEGYKRTPKCSSQGRPAAPPVRGIKKLSLRSAPSIADMGSPEQEALICHEIHFPAPPDASGQELLRYHITTRNFFAFLLNKPLVGLTFYQALIDLHERLMTCMPKDADHTELMVRYLTRNRLHNVCNDPVAASGLLAWCEDEEVQWQEGWREGFVHCCGLYSRLRSLPEFRDISHVSRTLLERSSIEIEARIGCAAERLSNFNFDDMWPVHNTAQPHSARASFYHFRTFLVGFYEKSYKGWPPRCAQNTDGNWLSRSVVARLQKDFGALYDYYVDRDVVWSQMMGPSEQYRNFIRTTNGIHTKVSDDNLCLEKLFVQFDHKHKFPHIPHPYPILPISIQTNDAARQQQKQALFGSKTKAYEKRIVHAYSEASNALLLGPEVASNGLVEAYQKFERTDHLGEINPRDARKGRWILLYGILETLSTISADTPNLFFTNAVSYFLNPRLKGTPPWMTGKGSFFEEASPMVSHCWMISRSSWGNNIIAT